MELDASQRKEFIILYAIELMNENGIHNISTKEIAKRLNISEGLIFKLYPKKSDLLLEILERFSQYDKDMLYTAMDKNENAMDAIRFYINSYLSYYENYPEITAVYQSYDSFHGDAILEQKTRSIFFGRISYLTIMIQKAQESGLVRSDLDAENVATILSSIIRGMCLKRRLTEGHFPLKEKTIEATSLVLAAIQI
ncbi:MAG: TetR family transcriptional regulator [Herbinix sp.]|jgi:AcrR family transcriptional regulator|nr:TetR family transcriptional regulator [Herbinix sp.]